MTTSQRLTIKSSEIRARLNELSGADDLTAEQRAEIDSLTKEYADNEAQLRAALIAEDAAETRALATEPDAEKRERVELRSRASLTTYLRNAMAGRLPSGAEAELNAAAGIGDGIPLELWDTPTETRADAPTGTPSTVGVNLDPIRPMVFANSIAPRLGIDMPRVGSGTYATATITTALTAGAKAKSAVTDSTASGFTVSTATPKRVSARMSITLEDVAAIGVGNFESALRENLSLVLSDELDKQAINGDGQAPNLTGILNRLTDPTAPTAVVNFDGFVTTFTDGIDGLWANTAKNVAVVAGVDTYRLSARTFRDATGQDLGDMAFSDYAMQHYGGWWTNKRMTATASKVQQAILYRKGRSFMGGSGAMRTAVCPHWNEVSIDDIYSGSAKGERYFTMHVLLGDVILVQPDAYAQVAFKVAA